MNRTEAEKAARELKNAGYIAKSDDVNVASWIDKRVADIIERAGGEDAAVCAAKHSDTGANDPQDCDWPFCGCDPKADKVIEAIQESGFTLVRDEDLLKMTKDGERPCGETAWVSVEERLPDIGTEVLLACGSVVTYGYRTYKETEDGLCLWRVFDSEDRSDITCWAIPLSAEPAKGIRDTLLAESDWDFEQWFSDKYPALDGTVKHFMRVVWNERLERSCRPVTWVRRPDAQGYWWHFSGEDLESAFHHVMVSKTGKDRFFVANGQDAPWCDEMGGFWLKQEYPNVPSREEQKRIALPSPPTAESSKEKI